METPHTQPVALLHLPRQQLRNFRGHRGQTLLRLPRLREDHRLLLIQRWGRQGVLQPGQEIPS